MRKIAIVLAFLIWTACKTRNVRTETTETTDSLKSGTFGYDLEFLKKYTSVVVLSDAAGKSKVAVIGDFQGRIMTSTSGGDEGTGYGWINYDLIKSKEKKPHINPVGGEDRLWMGPEGGQYSIFFKKGSTFDFANWTTPALIDTEPFDLVSSDSSRAVFRTSGKLVNHHGFEFQVEINRTISLLSKLEIQKEFGIDVAPLQSVGFKSENSVTNKGSGRWAKAEGLLSIWILGMFNPSAQTVIVLPHRPSGDPGDITDNYFGAIPADRIKQTDLALFLKGDGKFRGKVGISPRAANNIVGSYDAGRRVLTLVKFDVSAHEDYVNSKWEFQKEPYRGDAVNSYNDGPLADGSQLGPFYELESSSPARELKPGESMTHRHLTVHLEGTTESLDAAAKKALGISLSDIANAFH